MKYRLLVVPALEKSNQFKVFPFESKVEVLAAQNTAADILLFLQDDLGVMPDFSNIVSAEERCDGEWQDLED